MAIGVIAVVIMLIIPLPAFILDTLMAVNIVLSLLTILIVLLLGLLSWGFWRYRKSQKASARFEWNDAMLLGFLLFVSFTLGIVLTYFSFLAVP